MKKNMGNLDRSIRMVLAIVFIATYATGYVSGIIGSILIVFSVIFILTSLVSFCPLYTLLNLNTGTSKK